MSRAKLFFDSSALVAGAISPTGAARALLVLAETGLISIVVSEQVIAEAERAVARKAPRALSAYRRAVRVAVDRILRDPGLKAIEKHHKIIRHQADVPIVVSAMQGDVDYLVTLNRRHFIDDPTVAQLSGLRIGTPGDALDWLRRQSLLANEA